MTRLGQWKVKLAFVLVCYLFSRFLERPRARYDSSSSVCNHCDTRAATLGKYILPSSAVHQSPLDFDYGSEILARSNLGTGTGARVRRALRRASEGQPIRIGVLGGPTTSCKGLPSMHQDNTLHPDGFPMKLFTWWNATFPHHQNELTNGAPQDISYYSFCASKSLSVDVDLVVLEVTTPVVEVDLLSQYRDNYEFYETAIRHISQMQNQPAVILWRSFEPQSHKIRMTKRSMLDMTGFVSELSNYYDAPYFSLTASLQPLFFSNRRQVAASFFQEDSDLLNEDGHDLVASLLTRYLQDEMFSIAHQFVAQKSDNLSIFDSLLNPQISLPSKGSLIKSLGKINFPSKTALLLPQDKFRHNEPKPFCALVDDELHPLKSRYVQDWESWTPLYAREAQAFRSKVAGALIRVDISISAGRVAIRYLVGRDQGSADCWVDDNSRAAVRLDGYSPKSKGGQVTTFIDKQVVPGSHYVMCQIPQPSSGRYFSLTGVFST